MPWYKRTAVIVAFVGAGGSLLTAGVTGAFAAANDPPPPPPSVTQPVDCGTESQPYFDQQEQFPSLELSVNEDSELNKQCDLNDQLEGLREELQQEGRADQDAPPPAE